MRPSEIRINGDRTRLGPHSDERKEHKGIVRSSNSWPKKKAASNERVLCSGQKILPRACMLLLKKGLRPHHGPGIVTVDEGWTVSPMSQADHIRIQVRGAERKSSKGNYSDGPQ